MGPILRTAVIANGAADWPAEATITYALAAGAAVSPTPIGSGLAFVDGGSHLVLEALSERAPVARTRDDWRSIGHTLASLHQVHGARFGLDHLNGFFGTPSG